MGHANRLKMCSRNVKCIFSTFIAWHCGWGREAFNWETRLGHGPAARMRQDLLQSAWHYNSNLQHGPSHATPLCDSRESIHGNVKTKSGENFGEKCKSATLSHCSCDVHRFLCTQCTYYASLVGKGVKYTSLNHCSLQSCVTMLTLIFLTSISSSSSAEKTLFDLMWDSRTVLTLRSETSFTKLLL